MSKNDNGYVNSLCLKIYYCRQQKLKGVSLYICRRKLNTLPVLYTAEKYQNFLALTFLD